SFCFVSCRKWTAARCTNAAALVNSRYRLAVSARCIFVNKNASELGKNPTKESLTLGNTQLVFMEITIAIVSLVISIITLWLTYLHRGKVRMTQPTTIFFGWDGKDRKDPKVYLRTLLFTTSQRGRV